MDLILASTSPYKKQQISRLGVFFKAQSPLVDEEKIKAQYKNLPPIELSQKLAFEKAQSLRGKNPYDLIIGSDQLVSFENQVLDKPGTSENAVEQLLKFRNKTHKLITSVIVLAPDKNHFHTDITELTMRNLKPEQIQKYVDLDNPIDCAGAYKLESAGISLFSQIKSQDHSSIIGLPLIFISDVLIERGFSLYNQV